MRVTAVLGGLPREIQARLGHVCRVPCFLIWARPGTRRSRVGCGRVVRDVRTRRSQRIPVSCAQIPGTTQLRSVRGRLARDRASPRPVLRAAIGQRFSGVVAPRNSTTPPRGSPGKEPRGGMVASPVPRRRIDASRIAGTRPVARQGTGWRASAGAEDLVCPRGAPVALRVAVARHRVRRGPSRVVPLRAMGIETGGPRFPSV